MSSRTQNEPIVVTGIGLITALGKDAPSTWENIKAGRCGISKIRPREGVPQEVKLAAEIKLPTDFRQPDMLDVIRYSRLAFQEAVQDANLDFQAMDPRMLGVASTGHMGDLRHCFFETGSADSNSQIVPWWTQWLPQTATFDLAHAGRWLGPRLCFSTACASSLVSVIQSARYLRQGMCDVMVAGGAEQIEPLFAAGFYQMRALSDSGDHRTGCLPFDQNRSGFVMGEGAAFLVLERLSHAVARGAAIYAEILSERMLSQAHHLTSLNLEDEALTHLIKQTVRGAALDLTDVEYINAHGTGTMQNDITEINCINSVFGSHANQLHVSSTKSQIGHLVGASGSAELAVTLLGMRDRISPPTVNLQNPEPRCEFSCVANEAQTRDYRHSLKLSMAFGGHLAGIALRRYDGIGCRQSTVSPDHTLRVRHAA
ncbi:MAG TPA: beta-ketoacyl-[acyl-carrier-protein] synthase family protein [Pirellulaceae bacterium]|nr:beta-ketoacyl-[acyl-carrier-protein] synthase family protein [Pirellulaceae bacterium]HMO93286.1 beta-ketoacyl-[acyl-carrier-protein] synthase family protein [Pirellulaceae bacterium]HMP70174.1 beta-ketoacyl-[acyl-carrier-protein] synthase family protein [Pirellulaceae bacterium]